MRAALKTEPRSQATRGDAFKLTWISITMYPRPRLILCLSDPLAAAPFLPGARSWAARAFQDLGVTISVVDLPVNRRHDLLQAQRANTDNYGQVMPSLERHRNRR